MPFRDRAKTTTQVTSWVPVPFNPGTLSPIAWYDAADTSTITSSSGAVSQWNDKSVNAYHLTQATAAEQPTTGTRTINNLNVIDFDGTSDRLNSGFVVGQLATARAFTMFLVKQSDVLNATEGMVSFHRSTGFDFENGVVLGKRATNIIEQVLGRGDNASTFIASYTTSSSTAALLLTFVASASDFTKTFFTNSVPKDMRNVDGSMLVSSFLGSGSGNHQIRVGNRGGYNQFYFNGAIAELIVYDKRLTASEIDSVQRFLMNKWGLT